MKTTTFAIACSLTAQLSYAQEKQLDTAILRNQWQRESFAIAMPAMRQGGKYELRIGDTVPSTAIKLINGDTDTANITDFQGKYLLLSFWNSSCSVCLQAFPKLKRIQQDYADQLTVMPITFEIEPMARHTLKKQAEQGFPFDLPIIVRDSILRKYFPHQGDPYEIWIDPEGRFVAATNGAAVTDETVRRFVEQGIPPENTERYPFKPALKWGLSREEYLERKRKQDLD